MSEKAPMEQQDQQLSDALRIKLEQEVASLDAATRAKLVAARRNAIASMPAQRSWLPVRPWTLGAGLASFALLMLVLLPYMSPPPLIPGDEAHLTTTTAVLEDLSILTASDSVEFYQSVDFLLWLESSSGSEG